MREQIHTAVQIFRAHPDAESDEILERIMDTGIEQRLAIQLLLFVPLAYGRVMLSDKDIVFSNIYFCLGKPRKGRLDASPVWAEALDFAKQDPKPFFPIASRSLEVQIANEVLLDGKGLEEVIMTPPAFFWPIQLVPRSPGDRKPPGWLRRLWENPAQRYSMTHRERAVARAAMVAAIVVGLFAMSAVAYYGLSVIQAR